MIEMGLGQVISAMLLVGRIIASAYLLKVMQVQNMLTKKPAVDENGNVDEDVMQFRRTLNRMTFIILVGQVVPIIIDIVNTFSAHTPSWLIYLYAISNTITAITASVLIWRLYQLAMNTEEVNDLERAHVKEQHAKEMRRKQ